LARAMTQLAGDAGMRRRMGDASTAKARREFDQQDVIDITLRTYDELLLDRSARRHDRGTGLWRRATTRGRPPTT